MERKVERREIVTAILLSLVTCGIYFLYWQCVLTDEVKRLEDKGQDLPSGFVCLLLEIVTCGIFGFYWAYVIGKKIDTLKNNQNGMTGILYLILNLLGAGIVWVIIAQSEVNTFLDSNQSNNNNNDSNFIINQK